MISRRNSALAVAVVAGGMLAGPAMGCSICRCGDPTFNALGNEGVSQSGLRLALDWEKLEKSQGDPDDESSMVREQRTTLLVAYGISERLGVVARLPYAQRQLTEVTGDEVERSSASGLSDPEIHVQARLWSSRFEGEVGIRSSVNAIVGVKTDWGDNNVSRGGERLDEHVQPGTGSTDPFLGLSGLHQVDRKSALFASVQYRHTGRNDFGYRYGAITLLNLAYEHKLGSRWDAVLEANFRHSGRDEVDASGLMDPDTGGSIAYLTPRILFDAGHGWVIRGSAQIPLSNAGLNGRQDEGAVLNVGITWMPGN